MSSHGPLEPAGPSDAAGPSGRGATDDPGLLRTVASWLAAAGPAGVSCLTGAGISTESGIPDFRGPQGIWTKNPAAQRVFDLDAYLADPEVRRTAWAMRRSSSVLDARPNAGHRALVDLERSGRLGTLVTQNIDGLHQAAGSSPDRVVEIHGTVHTTECLDCGRRVPTTQVVTRLDAGEADPPCTDCGGVLKVATVSFGQMLPPDALDAAVAAARSCEVFLAVGTSLTVHPAAQLPGIAVRSGARLVVVNAEPTPYDDVAAAVLRGPVGRVLPVLVADLAPA